MSSQQLRQRVKRIEEQATPEREDGSYTLEELCRSIWRGDKAEYRETAKATGFMRHFIRQFELDVKAQTAGCAGGVAHRHGLHESLLGAWRRQHSQDRLQDAQGTLAEVTLLPVQVSVEAERAAPPAGTSGAPPAPSPGTIHIEFSHGHRLSVRGEVDANALSVMLRELSRT
jgi:hypothetical protein